MLDQTPLTCHKVQSNIANIINFTCFFLPNIFFPFIKNNYFFCKQQAEVLYHNQIYISIKNKKNKWKIFYIGKYRLSIFVLILFLIFIVSKATNQKKMFLLMMI